MKIDRDVTEFVYNILKNEAEDLAEISEDYLKVAETGFFNGRRHDKALGKAFATEFNIRADAVDIMAEYILKEMKKLET